MMAALEARLAAIAEHARQAAITQARARIEGEIPGIDITADADGLVLSGPGLSCRMIDEPALRWIGSVVR
jgi:hypothetical protein